MFPEKYLYYIIKINLDIDKYNQKAKINWFNTNNTSKKYLNTCYIRIYGAVLK